MTEGSKNSSNSGVQFQKARATPGDVVQFEEYDGIPNFQHMYLIDLDIRKKRNNTISIEPEKKRGSFKKMTIPYYKLTESPSLDQVEKGVRTLLYGKPGKAEFLRMGQGTHPKKATDLSMNFRMDCFVIIRFRIENIRFARDHHPLMREDKANTPLYWAKLISKEGKIIDDTSSPNPACKAAMFAFKHDNVAGTNYDHRFNMYLDIVDGDIDDLSAPYIPIIIDPDVRFPGGNQGP